MTLLPRKWIKEAEKVRTNKKHTGYNEITDKREYSKKLHFVYEVFAHKIETASTLKQRKWTRNLKMNDKEIEWKSAYMMAHKCSSDTDSITFLFRLSHRLITTNTF